MLYLKLRSRERLDIKQSDWIPKETTRSIEPNRVALLICDMWDQHWCQNATSRVGEMAPAMNRAVVSARNLGVQIIHSPSDTLEYYKNSPQSSQILNGPKRNSPAESTLPYEPPLPIDDTDGGCDTPSGLQTFPPNTGVWTRQHPDIEIFENDAISDSGEEIYSLLRIKGIELLVIMGVHTNMCILGRSFGIRQMKRWGVECALVRDMTDTMYNPNMPPFVTHFEGTKLVVEHIEKYCCATVLSSDFSGNTPFSFAGEPVLKNIE